MESGCTVATETVDKEILVLREYQKRVIEAALKGNTLAILPTGSGKTLIATYIIRERLKTVRQNIEAGEPKKLIAFLAPTKILVGQQLRYLSIHSDAAVVEFTGETHKLEGRSIGYWNYNGWTDVFAKQEVIVMTPQIMKQMLQRKFFKIEAFDCVVIDECHHAFGHNPLITICSMMKECSQKPLVFAMTASPLVSKRRSVINNLTQLEQNLNCKVLCGREILEEYKNHTPVARLSIFRFAPQKSHIAEKLLLNLENNIPEKNRATSQICLTFPGTISLPKQLSCFLLHTYIRAKHTSIVSTLYTFLENMRIPIHEISSVWSDRFPSVEIYKYYRSHGNFDGMDTTSLPKLFTPQPHVLKPYLNSASKIQDLTSTLGQVLVIAEECGIVCGLYAFMTSMSRRKVSKKHEHVNYASNRKGQKPTHGKAYKSHQNNAKQRAFLANRSKQGKQNAKKTQDARALSSVMDMDKLDHFVKELRTSPFQVVDLLHDEYVACTCILDFFLAFAFYFGPDICQRASIKYIQKHKKDQAYSFTFPIQVIKEFYKQGVPQQKIKILHVPKHHALVYLLLQAVVSDESTLFTLTSEGCFVLLENLWNLHIDVSQVTKSFHDYIFHEEHCRDAVCTAIHWLLKSINVDELKGWAEIDDEARLLTIEPLMMHGGVQDKQLSDDDEDTEQPLKFPVTKLSTKELLSEESSINSAANSDQFPSFVMITSKVKALSQIWSMIRSPGQELEWQQNQQQLVDAIITRHALESAQNTTENEEEQPTTAINTAPIDLMDDPEVAKKIAEIIEDNKSYKPSMDFEEGEIWDGEEGEIYEGPEDIVNEVVENIPDANEKENNGGEMMEFFPEKDIDNSNVSSDTEEDNNNAMDEACSSTVQNENNIPPIEEQNANEQSSAPQNPPAIPSSIDNDAYIVFCKMRLNTISLHFVLSLMLENIYEDEFIPDDMEDEDVDPFSKKYIRTEITGILKDMLGAVQMRGNSKFNYRKRICLEKDLITPPAFRPSHLIGSMNQKRQLGVLRLFKEGQYNIVFATEVMEEGLDVRACRYVINYDLPSTAKSFVQRKGRSRADNSMMISLIPLGDDGKKMLHDLKNFYSQEKTVEDITNEHGAYGNPHDSNASYPDDTGMIQSIPAADLNMLLQEESTEFNIAQYKVIDETNQLLEEFDGGFDMFEDFMLGATTRGLNVEEGGLDNLEEEIGVDGIYSVELNRSNDSSEGVGFSILDTTGTNKQIALQAKYVVESTGSEADIRSSRLILQKFCQQLPHDLAYIPQPIYWITKVPHEMRKNAFQFRCSILLPPYVPPYLRFIVGPVAASKVIAKGLASLEAVKLLHHYRELNDWLLTNGSKASAKLENSLSNNANKKDKVITAPTHDESGKSMRKRKLSARVAEDMAVETNELIDEKNTINVKVNEDDKDLVEISIKLIPDLLTLPATIVESAPVNISSSRANCVSPAEEIMQETISPQSEDIKLYLYVVQGKFSEMKARFGSVNCLSCCGLFEALNSFGLAYTQPLPEDVVETMFRGYIREQDGIDMKISFLKERFVSRKELMHMQRFHRSILCWETDLPNNNEWLDFDLNITETYPEVLTGYPIHHDAWRASSNGAWYVIFPVPEWQEMNPCNESEEYLMQFTAHELLRHEIFLSKEAFLSYLTQTADEVQVLVHNFIMIQDINREHGQNLSYYPPIISPPRDFADMVGMIVVRGSGSLQVVCEDIIQTDTDTGERIACVKKLPYICKFMQKSQVEHPRLIVTMTLKDMVDKIVATDEAVLASQSEGSTTTNAMSSSSVVSDPSSMPATTEKSPSAGDTKSNLSSSKSSKRDATSNENEKMSSPKAKKPRTNTSKVAFTPPDELVPITFLDLFSQRYPEYEDQLITMAKTPEHRLWRVVSIAGRLTLHCLFTKTANRFIKPNEKKLYDAATRNKKRPKMINARKLHTHASSVHVVPELLRPLGRYKWFTIGIMAPSVIWRIQSLVQAVEGRTVLMNMILKNRQEFSSTTTVSEAEKSPSHSGSVTVPCEQPSEYSDLLEKSPSASLMLEAFTPRLAEEIIDSERVELLGDSLLKLVTSVELYRLFPHKHEGFLTNQRIKVISNLFLLEMSYRFGVHHYIRGICISNGKQFLKIRPCGMSLQAIKDNRNIWNTNVQLAGAIPMTTGKPLSTSEKTTNKHPEAAAAEEEELALGDGTMDAGAMNIEDFRNTEEYFQAIYKQSLHESVEVKPKILADTIEAIIGAFYLSGGVEIAIEVVKALGAWPRIEQEDLPVTNIPTSNEITANLMDETKTKEMNNAAVPTSLIVEYQPTVTELIFPEHYPEVLKRVAMGSLYYMKDDSSTDPQMMVDTMTNNEENTEENLEDYELSGENDPMNTTKTIDPNAGLLPFQILPCKENATKIIDQLDEILHYRFKNWAILQEALTHCSCQESQSNQRLEFLGDAVLDFVVVVLLYQNQLWAEPGDLSQQKQSSTCNKNLGYIGAQLQLYQFLKFHSTKLSTEFEELHESFKKLDTMQSALMTGKPIHPERTTNTNTNTPVVTPVDSTPTPTPSAAAAITGGAADLSGKEKLPKKETTKTNGNEKGSTKIIHNTSSSKECNGKNQTMERIKPKAEDTYSEYTTSTTFQSDIERSSNEFNHIIRPMPRIFQPPPPVLSLSLPTYIGITSKQPMRTQYPTGMQDPLGNTDMVGDVIETVDIGKLRPLQEGEEEEEEGIFNTTSTVTIDPALLEEVEQLDLMLSPPSMISQRVGNTLEEEGMDMTTSMYMIVSTSVEGYVNTADTGQEAMNCMNMQKQEIFPEVEQTIQDMIDMITMPKNSLLIQEESTSISNTAAVALCLEDTVIPSPVVVDTAAAVPSPPTPPTMMKKVPTAIGKWLYMTPHTIKKTMVLGNTASKAIADLFEALMGAIYLDSQGDLDAVTIVIKHINLLPQLADESVLDTALWDNEEEPKKKSK